MAHTPIKMLLDMNSYFASVEQQANPLLRGRPVGVCAYLSKNGCIIAASVEAKQYGVKTAMRIRDAQKLCPNIILVENEPAKYRYISQQIFALLAEYSDNVSPFSIDEAFVDLTGWARDYTHAVTIAQEIKQRIHQEIGSWLRCSIGISYTNWLAKFAADEHKPDGLTVILKEHELSSSYQTAQVYFIKTVFKNRPLTHACGIAYRMESRLRAMGIFDLYMLQRADPHVLLRRLGKYGYVLWAHVNGIEMNGWIKKEGAVQKSIGHSYCIPRQTTDKQYLQKILYKLCEKTGRRLRASDQTAQLIYGGCSYVGQGGVWRRKKLSSPIYTTQEIFQHAWQVIAQTSLTDKVRLLAVSVGGLAPYAHQLSLWHDATRQHTLSVAVDALNTVYGEYVVYPGILHGLDEQARDRIGFRKTVEVKRDED